MKFQFLILFFLSLVNFARAAESQILLVPEKDISFSKYTEECKKEGYFCTHIMFDEKLKAANTPTLNALIEDFDLLSNDFRKILPQKIENLLKTEMISIEQAETIIQMIEKSFQFERNTRLKYLQDELAELVNRLKSFPEQEFEVLSYLVLKKRLTAKQFSALQLSPNKLFSVAIVTHHSLPKSPLALEVSLLNGTCESPLLNESLESAFQIRRTQTLFQNECSFSKSFNQSLAHAKDSIVKNKSTLFWISAAVGAYLIMNQYQVELTF